MCCIQCAGVVHGVVWVVIGGGEETPGVRFDVASCWGCWMSPDTGENERRVWIRGTSFDGIRMDPHAGPCTEQIPDVRVFVCLVLGGYSRRPLGACAPRGLHNV